jgi:hypothetical protein
MPLLPDGSVICLKCEKVRTIADNEWVLSDEDQSAFATPVCPTPGCNTFESFTWHDAVAIKQVFERRSVGKIDPDGPEQFVEVSWAEADPDHFHARHMVSIEQTAKRLGRKRRAINPHGPEIKYPKPPKAHTADEMRAVAKFRGKSLREPPKIKTKADADKAHKEQIEAVDRARSERVAFKEEERLERGRRLSEQQGQDVKPVPIKADHRPEIDKPSRVVSQVEPDPDALDDSHLEIMDDDF